MTSESQNPIDRMLLLQSAFGGASKEHGFRLRALNWISKGDYLRRHVERWTGVINQKNNTFSPRPRRPQTDEIVFFFLFFWLMQTRECRKPAPPLDRCQSCSKINLIEQHSFIALTPTSSLSTCQSGNITDLHVQLAALKGQISAWQ